MDTTAAPSAALPPTGRVKSRSTDEHAALLQRLMHVERLLQDTVVQVAAQAVKSRQLQEDEQLDYETDMYHEGTARRSSAAAEVAVVEEEGARRRLASPNSKCHTPWRRPCGKEGKRGG